MTAMNDKHPPTSYTVAVAGNPNAGKTTLFNMLTGDNQTVGNYPGVTVEKKVGQVDVEDIRLHIIDLPGTYSLTAYSLEEVVARDFIVEETPDVVLDVIDASNLERNLYLALQLAEIGRPLVLALNMHDIARQRGIHIDIETLSTCMGVPVVATVGHRGSGGAEVLQTVKSVAMKERAVTPLRVTYGPELEEAIRELIEVIEKDKALNSALPRRWLAVKLLEEDARVAEKVQACADDPAPILDRARKLVDRTVQHLGEDPTLLIAEHRYGHAAGIVRRCVKVSDRGTTLTDAIDTIVCNRFLGFFFVALVMLATFKTTFLLADGLRFVPWFGGWTTPVGVCAWIFQTFLPGLTAGMEPGPLKSMLNDGIIGGVGGVMGFVPLIFFMFLILAFIEDSGYIARVAFVLDRVLRTFGLQGKSILAMIIAGGIAGGCAVPGVMATRTLREERDRLTTMLVVPFMNCGAKMPVFAMLIAAFFSRYRGEMLWFLAGLSWCFALGGAFVLRRTVVRGEQTPFVMELPPYHVPMFRTVARSALERSWMYLKKAGTIILGVSLLLWAMMYFPQTDQQAAQRQRREAIAEFQTFLETEGRAASTLELDPETLVRIALQARQGQRQRKHRELARRAPVALALIDNVLDGTQPTDPALLPIKAALEKTICRIVKIEARQRREQLRHSLAGHIGRLLEPLTRLAGFDWRDNVALIGGWTAKEVIVSTMSIAYSMDINPECPARRNQGSELPLVEALRHDPRWNPLRAFALILFIMLYAPCLVTLVAIGRESGSWKWAVFSTMYSTGLALTIAIIVYRLGLAFGLGIS